MRFPLPLTVKIAAHILRHRFLNTPHFATVLQLEPLHTCNLRCTGCGRIREYAATLKDQMSLEECLAAAKECDAPMVSICGGEPLIYPQINELVAGLREQGRIVYICTNGTLLRRKLREYLAVQWARGLEEPRVRRRTEAMIQRLLGEELLSKEEAAQIRAMAKEKGLADTPAIAPTRWLYWNIHLDGLEATHDMIVERPGVFREAVLAIRMAKLLGFQVATNTTVYKQTDMAEIADLFTFLGSLGVDGHTISPGYNFEEAAGAEQEREGGDAFFLTRADTAKKFADIEAWGRQFPILGTPVYLEFLAGKRDLPCAAWAIPTRNPRGWRGPCYLVADTHYKSYRELLEETDWSRLGRPGGEVRDKRCEHCMVHCGFEPSASLGLESRRGDLWKTLRFQFGARPRPAFRPVNAFNAPKPPAE